MMPGAPDTVTSATGKTNAFSTQNNALAAFLCFLILISSAFHYGRLLGSLEFSHNDEYLTLDRAGGFLTHQDSWTVYSENRPSFKKPPLQYYASSVLLRSGADIQTATRLPSLVFGLALLVVTGLFARTILPSNPWVAPMAMLLLASQTAFWQSSVAALLDAGNVLFSILALLAMRLALRDPRWWYGVAAACVAGALQKAPVPIALVAVALATVAAERSLAGAEILPRAARRHFWPALCLAVGGILAWPLIELAQYGRAAFNEFFLVEVANRFSPLNLVDDEKYTNDSLYKIVFSADAFMRATGIAAAVFCAIRFRKLEIAFIPVGILVYIALSKYTAGNISIRYFVYFAPLISIALALTIACLDLKAVLKVLMVALLSATSMGPLKSADSLEMKGNISAARYHSFLVRFAERTNPDDTLVFCAMPAAKDLEGPRIRPSAFSFFASKGRTFETLRPGDLPAFMARKPAAPAAYRGLCTSAQFEAFRDRLEGALVVEREGEYVHWTSEGSRGDPGTAGQAPARQ